MSKKNTDPDPADRPDAQASAQAAGLNPAGPFGRQVASDPEQRDRAVQDANPGYTTPYDQAGQPAPKTAADIAVDPAQNPHNVQGIPGAHPDHYRDGKLTREGMVAAVRRGGSVLHKGAVINDERKLPSEADLAQGDARAMQQALAGLDAQQRELDAQRQKLQKLLAASAAPRPQETADASAPQPASPARTRTRKTKSAPSATDAPPSQPFTGDAGRSEPPAEPK